MCNALSEKGTRNGYVLKSTLYPFHGFIVLGRLLTVLWRGLSLDATLESFRMSCFSAGTHTLTYKVILQITFPWVMDDLHIILRTQNKKIFKMSMFLCVKGSYTINGVYFSLNI